jgi:hypothetical protein
MITLVVKTSTSTSQPQRRQQAVLGRREGAGGWFIDLFPAGGLPICVAERGLWVTSVTRTRPRSDGDRVGRLATHALLPQRGEARSLR